MKKYNDEPYLKFFFLKKNLDFCKNNIHIGDQ
jgi:hypothetical protein